MAKTNEATDAQILAAVRSWGATYMVRNRLNDFGRGPNLTTAQVLRRLKKLETAGKVKRAASSYAVMICWQRTELTND